MPKQIFAELRDNICTYFNEKELINLCFDLKIEYEELNGTGKKCIELVQYCLRHNRMNDLVDRLKELRPHISWEVFKVNPGEPIGSNDSTTNQSISFSFLRQWKPNEIPNAFGADILLRSKLDQEEIISFIRFLTTQFILYTDTDEAPIIIRLWSSELAYTQDQDGNYGDEFRQGYLAFYVKNLTGKGVYNGFNEIRWMQEKGRFSKLFGTKTKL